MKETGIITKLAWRNVWRNRRRTGLTLMTILVGCGMIIFMNAWAKGAHDKMIKDAVLINTGYIQIHEKGYWDNRTIDYAFRASRELIEIIKNSPRISGYSARIQAGGLLSHEDNTAASFIQGVDPSLETNVTILHTKVLPGGRYLEEGDAMEIVIGEILAKKLGASVGSAVSMISQGFDGSIAAEKFTVVGLIRSGNPEYDQTLLLMTFAQAQETFAMKDYIHSLTLKLTETAHTEAVSEKLLTLVSKKIEVMGWDKLMPELVQFIVMDDISAYIFDFILFMVVAFGILNTIQMSVFERTREFGVMLSIGTRPEQVVKMVLMESVYISILGIALGILLGCSAGYYFYINPMDFSGYAEEMAVWGVSTTIFPVDTTLLNVIATSAITLVLSLIFSLFPARRASRLKPVEAIRHL